MGRATFILLLAPLALGACEQQKQAQDQWVSTQSTWAQAEVELNTSSREVMAQLRTINEGPKAGTAAELIVGLEGALNELRKTRITVLEDVKQGPPGPQMEERIAAAGARMSSALAKVEGRLEAARRLVQPPEVKNEDGAEVTK